MRYGLGFWLYSSSSADVSAIGSEGAKPDFKWELRWWILNESWTAGRRKAPKQFEKNMADLIYETRKIEVVYQ